MDIDKCIIESLDGKDVSLLPFIPYLLQDLREIGADPIEIVKILKGNVRDLSMMQVADLGCGKGAVSVAIAKEFACHVDGIDAIPEFIDSAKEYAKELQVETFCNFRDGDIRLIINDLNNYDIVILGAIGSVLGNEYETFVKVKKMLQPKGYLVLDHVYLPDDSNLMYEKCCSATDFYRYVEQAGFEIIEERIMDSNNIEGSNNIIYKSIETRTLELIQKFPNQEKVLRNYLNAQVVENKTLENDLVCGTWLLRARVP